MAKILVLIMPHKLNYRRLKKKNWQTVQQGIHFTTNITKPSILTFNKCFKLNQLVHSWLHWIFISNHFQKHENDKEWTDYPGIFVFWSIDNHSLNFRKPLIISEDNRTVIEQIIPLDFFIPIWFKIRNKIKSVFRIYQIQIIYLVLIVV